MSAAAGAPRVGVGETLRAALALMRDHPRETMAPLALTQGPVAAVTVLAGIALYATAFAGEPYPDGGLAGASGGAPLAALVTLQAAAAVLGLVGAGATIVSVAALAKGRPIGLREAFDPAFTRLGRLIALAAILLVAGVLLAALMTLQAAAAVVGLAALPFLLPRVAVAFQALMLEDAGPLEALRRSWRLTHGHMLRLLGILIAAIVILAAIAFLAPTVPGPEEAGRGARMAIDAAIQALQTGLFIPAGAFAHGAVTLYYLRIREDQP